MRVIILGVAAAVLVACARDDERVSGDTAAGMADAPASTVALSDLAGRWNMVATPQSGADTSSTRYTMVATGDTSGWSMSFPNEPQSVPLRIVAVEGDSVVIDAGPYQSVRRRGVQVSTRNVLRKEGDRLVGHVRARYSSGRDTVLMLRTEGTRAP